MPLLPRIRPKAEPDYVRRPTAYCGRAQGRGSSLSVLRPARHCRRATVASTSQRGGSAEPFGLRGSTGYPVRRLPGLSGPGSRSACELPAIVAEAHADILRNAVTV